MSATNTTNTPHPLENAPASLWTLAHWPDINRSGFTLLPFERTRSSSGAHIRKYPWNRFRAPWEHKTSTRCIRYMYIWCKTQCAANWRRDGAYIRSRHYMPRIDEDYAALVILQLAVFVPAFGRCARRCLCEINQILVPKGANGATTCWTTTTTTPSKLPHDNDDDDDGDIWVVCFEYIVPALWFSSASAVLRAAYSYIVSFVLCAPYLKWMILVGDLYNMFWYYMHCMRPILYRYCCDEFRSIKFANKYIKKNKIFMVEHFVSKLDIISIHPHHLSPPSTWVPPPCSIVP